MFIYLSVFFFKWSVVYSKEPQTDGLVLVAGVFHRSACATSEQTCVDLLMVLGQYKFPNTVKTFAFKIPIPATEQ